MASLTNLMLENSQRFNGSNYNTWKQRMLTIFEYRRLDALVLGTETRPVPTSTPGGTFITTDQDKFDDRNREAVMLLKLSVTDDQLPQTMLFVKNQVDGHIQRLDKYMKKFDEELRRERELAGALGAMDQNTDNSGRIGRGNESSKPGRKRSQVVSEPLNIDLDLPVDPNEPTYCFCNQVSYGEMIACDGPDCNIEWFHYGCVGIKERPKGNWYCPNCIGNDRRRKGK